MPFVLLADVKPERVAWLMRGYLPRGKVTLLDGNGGIGKTTLLLDLAARLSRGAPLPDGSAHPPLSTLLLTLEDGLGDTIRPRLEAAGADLARVGALPTITLVDRETGKDYEALPTLPDYADTIGSALDRLPEPVGLVVVDPVMSYLAAAINGHRDQDVRRALTPLVALAEQTGAAVVLTRHLNKAASSDALMRGQGSVAFTNVCRSALLAAPDPDDEARFVLAQTKTNLGPPAPALAYRLVGCPNGAARVEWLGTSPHTGRSLLGMPQDKEERGALAQAKEIIRDLLKGGPRPAHECEAELKAAGIASAGARFRAKQALGVRSRKTSGTGPWEWALPDDRPEPAVFPPPRILESWNLDAGTGQTRRDQDSGWNLGGGNIPLAASQDSNIPRFLGVVNAAREARGLSPLSLLPPVPFAGRLPCAACGAEASFAAGAVPVCAACRGETAGQPADFDRDEVPFD